MKLLSAQDLDDLGAQVVLANTYHLMLRPGVDVVGAMGGLHGFIGWEGHFLTDSGGYQVMSLPCSLDDDGVTFRSSYDGSWQRLTPEGAVAAQEVLGADIQMVLDVCTELPADRERSHRSGRANAGLGRAGSPGARPVPRPAPVRDRAGRRRARPSGRVRRAVGGDRLRRLRRRRSLGRRATRPRCWPPWLPSTANLPADSPRYLMGVGDPGLAACSDRARGRHVRLRVAYSPGPARFGPHQRRAPARKGGPVSPRTILRSTRAARAPSAGGIRRAYLRHLYNVGEPSAGRLVSLHNLAWLTGLVARARQAVLDGQFAALCVDEVD